MQIRQVNFPILVHKHRYFNRHVRSGFHVANGSVLRVRVNQPNANGNVVCGPFVSDWNCPRQVHQIHRSAIHKSCNKRPISAGVHY